jgi:TonB family protein
MDELSSPTAVIQIPKTAPSVRKRLPILREVLFLLAATLVLVPSLRGQSSVPVGQPPPPRAIYAPKPVYRPEWAKQRLTGKGVVLVTIDKQTGNVTGARMLTSTGNQQLDGAALETYSQWRFDPRTVAVSQLKIPIEFAVLAKPQPPKRTLSPPAILVILLAIAGVAIAFLRSRKA